MNKGFTLIELLVVVLIIGILAAVALPMYNRSVEKSRAAEALLNIRAINDAEQRYRLEHGVYQKDLALLDFELPGVSTYSDTEEKTRYQTQYFQYASATSLVHAYRLSPSGATNKAYVIGADYFSGQLYCFWYDSKYKVFCKNLSGGSTETVCNSFPCYNVRL